MTDTHDDHAAAESRLTLDQVRLQIWANEGGRL
jgi:hypothetical protein